MLSACSGVSLSCYGLAQHVVIGFGIPPPEYIDLIDCSLCFLLILVLSAAIEHLRERLPLARRSEVDRQQRGDRDRRRRDYALLKRGRPEALIDLIPELLGRRVEAAYI